jgi:hypothetical protein
VILVRADIDSSANSTTFCQAYGVRMTETAFNPVNFRATSHGSLQPSMPPTETIQLSGADIDRLNEQNRTTFETSAEATSGK